MLKDINISNLFEQIVFPDWYSNNRLEILLIVIKILFIIHLCLIFRDGVLRYFEIKRFKNLITSMVQGIMTGSIYAGFGIFLKMINSKMIENINAPIYLFILLFVVLTLYFIINLAIYFKMNVVIFWRNVDKIISELAQYLIYSIGFLLLLLGYVGRLDAFEAIIGIMVISLFNIIKNDQIFICKDVKSIVNYIKQYFLKNKENILRIRILPEKCKQKLQTIEVFSFNEEEDIPVTKKEYLYPKRRQQLSYLIGELKERNFDEPFALAITGRWGSGKTCFLNALKNELKEEAYFIFVEPKIENSMEKMLRNIKIQFNKIFTENGIYAGKSSSLKSYFDTIFYILGNQIGKEGFSVISKMFQLSSVELDSFNEARDKINEDIKILLRQNSNKRIYVLIDDLDRSEESEIFETFKFIKEILELSGCTILFFVDYEKIISEKITREYLDKFINDRIILEDISYIDLHEYYNQKNQILFKKDFMESSEFINESVKTLQRSFLGYIENVINIYYEIFKKKEDVHEESVIAKYDNDTIIRDLSNPRKFKKLLRELKRVLRIVNKFWFSNPKSTIANLSSDDCVSIAFLVSFIKIILEEEYEKLIFLKDIRVYLEQNDGSKDKEYVTRIIKNCVNNNYYANETKIVLFNGILYYMFHEDIIDKMKTNEQKIEDSLKENSKIEFEFFQAHLEEYFQYLLSIKEEKEFTKKFKNIINYIESLEDKVKISYTMELITFVEKVFKYNNGYFIKKHIKEIKPLLNVPEQYKTRINNLFGYMIEGALYQIIHSIVSFILMVDFSDEYEEIKMRFKDVNTVKKLYEKLSDEYMKYNCKYIITETNQEIDECKLILIDLKRKITEDEEIKRENLMDLAEKYYSDIIKVLDIISEINELLLIDASISRINSIDGEEIKFINYDDAEVNIVLDEIKNYIKEDYKLEETCSYYTRLCIEIERGIKYKTSTMKLSKETINELENVYKTLDKKRKDTGFDKEWWNYSRIRLYKIKLSSMPSEDTK